MPQQLLSFCFCRYFRHALFNRSVRSLHWYVVYKIAVDASECTRASPFGRGSVQNVKDGFDCCPAGHTVDANFQKYRVLHLLDLRREHPSKHAHPMKARSTRATFDKSRNIMNALGRQRLKQQVSSPKGGTTTATAAASRQLEGLCQECDDSSSYKSYIERDAEGLYPISYQCETSPQWVTSEITIQFDYEMIIADDDDDGSITSNNAKEENVRAMAWSFLEYVAKQTGISQRCNFDLQYEDSFIRPSGGTRRRQLQQSFLYYPTTIYSIRSLPEDRFGMTGAF